MPVTKYVASWMASADDDVRSVKALLKEGISNPSCFHSQQSAEKYFKAFLANHGQHIRKVHDLPALLNLCIAIDDSFKQLEDDAKFLVGFYVEARYADDYPHFTLEEAKQAYEAAERVKEFVAAKLS